MYIKKRKINTLIIVMTISLLLSVFINPSTVSALQIKDRNESYYYLLNLDEEELNNVEPKYIESFIAENELYINSEGFFDTRNNDFIPLLNDLNDTKLKEVIKYNEIEIFEETTPEETAPEETVPEETAPEETVPEETAPEETVPEETAPEETVPEETVPEETAPEETVLEETAPEETVPEETAPEETVPEETAPEETVLEETAPEEAVPEETVPEETIPKEILKKNMFSISTYATNAANVTTYTVKTGDYLSLIAAKFSVTVDELVLWNNLSDKNIIRVGQILNVTRPVSLPKPNFANKQEFVQFAATYASQVAKNKGVYASVMIAQAILESDYGKSKLSGPPNNNLFGIKSFKVTEPRVNMRTAEQDSNGNVYYIDAFFRVYPSYYESFEGNANLLRNNKLYSGTWIENTKSYKDATAWLQGRYATDVKYASKLNGLIEEYNLTQYDTTFRIETNHFLGEGNVQENLAKLKRTFGWDARYEEVTNVAPFYSKEFQIGEFYYLGDVQKAVEAFKKETGFWASYRQSDTFSHYYVIKTGTFNGLTAVKEAIKKFEKETGWYGSYERVDGERYRIVTGYFLGETNLNRGLDYMRKQGWWSESVKLNEKEPNYIMYTGEFNSEWSISTVKQYFNNKSWSFKDIPTGKTIKYYRIVTNESLVETDAVKRIKLLKDTFNWGSYKVRN